MQSSLSPRTESDALLFTPGPLTTSPTVKQAMLHDAGSRDARFIALVGDIRRQLLHLGGVSVESGYEAVLMQGSGTFGVEATLGSLLPDSGQLLVLINGAYGERILKIAERLRLNATALRTPEDRSPSAREVGDYLNQNRAVSAVAVVHCETTTGILNPLEELAQVVKQAGCRFIVDAMSSFGAMPIPLGDLGIDALISSANKCIEGVPGFSFVLVRREWLQGMKGQARSLSLDLTAQWEGLQSNGQFRFTPPTHALLAFAQALRELEAEGGVEGRGARYQRNQQTLVEGMRRLGFRPYLEASRQSCIITAFHYPQDARFQFEVFYQRLAERGLLIYPGKLSQVDCFRIGSIGRLDTPDIQSLLEAIGTVMQEMQISLPT